MRLGQEGFDQVPVLKAGQSTNGTLTSSAGLYTANRLVSCSGVNPQINIPINNPNGQSRIIVGASFIQTGYNKDLMGIMSDGGTVMHTLVGVNSLGQPYATRNGTLLGTSADAIVLDGTTRHYLELDTTIGDAPAGAVDIWIDGSLFLSLTGVDTRNAGTIALPDSVRLLGTTNTKWGDLVWRDTTGSAPYNAVMGDQLVLTLLPSGDGASSQWLGSDGNSVNNSLLVDERPLNTTDYVASSTPGQRDLYAMEDLPVAGTVHGVQLHAYALKTDAGARSVKLIERTGSAGNAVQASTARPLGTTTYSMIAGELLTADADGAAWDVSKVNAMQAGVELV